jgi:death on curing protein
MREPVWIEERDALAIHDRILALHGGSRGIREVKLLQSALARPRQHYAYADARDIVQMAAAYIAGIVRNHPFIDGNKRTGFVTGVLFLELNGYRFKAAEGETAQAVFALASGSLTETEFTAWLRSNVNRQRTGR